MHDHLRRLPDGVHFERESRYQDIVLASYRGYLALVLDEQVEVHSFDEHRFHEALCVAPMLFREPGSVRSVLIAGGGDGLCARRLLRFAEIESLVVCEIDDEISALARRPPLSLINEQSLADPRLELVHEEITEYAGYGKRRFDLIVCDLPAPRFRPLERLYTRAFYDRLRARLAPEGLLSVAVPFLPQTFACCHRELSAAFTCVYPYRCPMQSRGMAGFMIGAAEPIARRRGVPGWCEYLNEQIVPTLFSLAKDEWHFIGQSTHSDAVRAWHDDHGRPLDDLDREDDERYEEGGDEDALEDDEVWDDWADDVSSAANASKEDVD